MKHYFSLQYSDIQKTILRHNKLGSMAGISMMLSRLNEIEIPEITRKHGGTVMVAGGGKYTGYFKNQQKAGDARSEMIRTLSTSFPMLEFQASEVVIANNFETARHERKLENDQTVPGILDELSKQKRRFRGYAVTFNPHLKLCDDCGEYPMIKGLKQCSVCHAAEESAKSISTAVGKNMDRNIDREGQTSIEFIYRSYLIYLAKDIAQNIVKIKIPQNFEDLFPENKDDKDKIAGKRMAVWFSDINNMKDKVNIWLGQDEDKIFDTFLKVKDVFTDVIIKALEKSFPKPEKGMYLPFRIIIAGGDDFCIVMPEKYILQFVLNLSDALHETFDKLESDHPLSQKWLNNNRLHEKEDKKEEKKEIGPYCFGGSFIVTSLHTPFRKIFEIGEELMKTAKQETKRKDNSVNWRVLAEVFSQAEDLIQFDRPLLIRNKNVQDGPETLSFADYVQLRKHYMKKSESDENGISSSHRYQIIEKIIEQSIKWENDPDNFDPDNFERWLMKHAASELEKSFSGILKENKLKKSFGIISKEGEQYERLSPERIATLFELMSIEG